MLSVTIGASLIGNMLAGYQGWGVIRASEGTIIAGHDF